MYVWLATAIVIVSGRYFYIIQINIEMNVND